MMIVILLNFFFSLNFFIFRTQKKICGTMQATLVNATFVFEL